VLKTPQAPGDATVLKRFFRDNFITFSRRSKRIAFFGISEFFYVCLYANFQFSRWSRDHFSAPFRGLYLPNAWSQTLQTGNRNTFRVFAFHRYHWFGIKLFPIDCIRRTVEGTLKRENAVFWIWFDHATTFQNFSR